MLPTLSIGIENRIAVTPQLAVAPGQGLDRIQFLVNGFDTRSDGVDVVGSWTRSIPGGRATVTAAYNYNRTRISKALPALPLAILAPRIEKTRPQHGAVVTGVLDVERLHVTSRLRYYGSFVDALPFDQSPFVNQKVSPVAFVDLGVSYDVRPATQITVGAENLFGTYPDRATGALSLLGYRYPLIRPYDEDGGRLYVRFRQRL